MKYIFIAQKTASDFMNELESAAKEGYKILPETHKITTFNQVDGSSPTGIGYGFIVSIMMEKKEVV